jgi:hypothetical protein
LTEGDEQGVRRRCRSSSPILADVQGAVGKIAALSDDALVPLFDSRKPSLHIPWFDRLNAEPNPLVSVRRFGRGAQAREQDEEPPARRLDQYRIMAETQRRLIESLQLHHGRKQKDVTPPSSLRDAEQHNTDLILDAIRTGEYQHG